MAEGNRGGVNAGEQSVLLKNLTKLPVVDDLVKEYTDATDLQSGGFNQLHLRRSAATFVNWIKGEPHPMEKAAAEVKAPEKPTRFGKVKTAGKYGTAGLSAFGVVGGTNGFRRAWNEGDNAGMILNGANVGVCGTDLTLNFMKAAGKANKIVGAAKFVGRANVVLCVADIAYETYHEPGKFIDRDADGDLTVGHKGERFIASTASAAAGMAGFAAGTAFAGVVGGAILLPAAIALADAYLVNKAANIIIDTRRTYEEVDKTFRPDQKRHSNLVGAMARVLGNDAYNKSLQEAGVPVDPETGKVSMKTLNAALADEKSGPFAMGRLKGCIMDIRDKDRQVKAPWTPRWIHFTEAQGDKRYKYEMAKMEARGMDSALTEADGYVTALKAKRAQALGDAQAKLDAAMKPFNDLPPEIQEDIVMKLKRDYAGYKAQAGGTALDEAAYIAGAKITAANDKQLVDAFKNAEAALAPHVHYVAGRELETWKKQHPGATEGEIAGELKQHAADLRHLAINDPAAFQKKIETCKEQEAASLKSAPETAAVQASPAPLRRQGQYLQPGI